MYLEYSVLSHDRNDGMQNPMSSMGILGKFMKEKSTEVEEIASVPAGKLPAGGVSGRWQVSLRVTVSHRLRAGRAKGLAEAL